jgi:protein ImuA
MELHLHIHEPGLKHSSMLADKSDIINRLKREIFLLGGLGFQPPNSVIDLKLGFMANAFPQGCFPLGAVHELISEGPEDAASTAGFTAALVSGLMKNGGAAVWIGQSPILFPPALKSFGIRPDQLIFIVLKKEKDLLWALEEALKCSGLSAVIGELPELGFTHSRRFQLAVEQSKVTGFILRSNPRSITPNSCIARWKIRPLPSSSEDNLPGLGHTRWQVDLLKIRNGRPGSWALEWLRDNFNQVEEKWPSILIQPERKTG